MNNEKEANHSFDIYYFIKLVWKWKLPIVIITALAGLLTYIFTGPRFVDPLYKATVIFYPTTNTMLSNSLLTEPGTQAYRINEFGSEEDGEQLLQILKSEDLRNDVIIKFNLAAHYGFDTTGHITMLNVRSMLAKQMEVKQTEYKAIQIIILDKDPQTAADMANYIADYADKRKNNIQKFKSKQALEILENEYLQQRKNIDSMNGILSSLRQKGLYDYFEQSSQLNQSLSLNSIRLQHELAMLKVYESTKEGVLPDTLLIKTRARIQGYQAAIKAIKPNLEIISKYGGDYLNNIDALEFERKKLNSLKMRYESLKLDYEKMLSQQFMINEASKPEIPSTPRRILTSAVVMISTLLLSLLLIAVIDYYPNIRRNLA